MARECTINTAGGKVSIELSVDNGIISGGDFSIYGFSDAVVLLSFKIHTELTGKETYTVDLDRNALVGKVLSWQVLSCSPIATDSCSLAIKIFQDGQECAMNKPAVYALKAVPSCTLSQALPAKGGLLFVKNN